MPDRPETLTAQVEKLRRDCEAALTRHPARLGMSENRVGPFECHCAGCERSREILGVLDQHDADMARLRQALVIADTTAANLHSEIDKLRQERLTREQAEIKLTNSAINDLDYALNTGTLVSVNDRARQCILDTLFGPETPTL